MDNSFFYIAIIPPEEICKEIKDFQKLLSEQFDCHRSLRHIPHITLIPPFHIKQNLEVDLKNLLEEHSKNVIPFDISIENFSHFKKHTLFAEIKSSDMLAQLHFDLLNLLNNQPNFLSKPIHYFQQYNPHITLAYRDLEPNFNNVWNHFKNIHN